MIFKIIAKNSSHPVNVPNTIFLRIDNWDDYSFRTTFYMIVVDSQGVPYDIGSLKIGYKGQTTEKDTHEILPLTFSNLEEGFFSLGENSDYYKNLMAINDSTLRDYILKNIKDVVYSPETLEKALNEDVFKTSLLRGVNINTIHGQFTRIINNLAELTPYNFTYKRSESDRFSELQLKFRVKPLSTPPTNIHAIIGRNGVGKTTLLNSMMDSVLSQQAERKDYFINSGNPYAENIIEKDYFSSIVSVSFSAFDPFDPPKEQSDPTKGTCYFYIGLKKTLGDMGVSNLLTIHELRDKCLDSLLLCFSEENKKKRWLNAIDTLESDGNFAEMKLNELPNLSQSTIKDECLRRLTKMSSGHAIVLLTITKLIEKVEEKTLVLIDEPESHLHPPLLSAFTRALSDLLMDRNGVSIIATHSPVILQEIPKGCTWIITRFGKQTAATRPSVETFGENVGILTREVFRLEVERSGYHALLKKHVDSGKTYNEIMEVYSNQLGYEGQVILKTLVSIRDRKQGEL